MAFFRFIRDFASFSACSPFNNCPSVRCATAGSVACRDVDLFGAKNVLHNHNIIIIMLLGAYMSEYMIIIVSHCITG
jgi:hypothetical protein